MESLFAAINTLLARDDAAVARALHMRTYRVIPLGPTSGMVFPVALGPTNPAAAAALAAAQGVPSILLPPSLLLPPMFQPPAPFGAAAGKPGAGQASVEALHRSAPAAAAAVKAEEAMYEAAAAVAALSTPRRSSLGPASGERLPPRSAGSVDVLYGCPKCRYLRGGCNACRCAAGKGRKQMHGACCISSARASPAAGRLPRQMRKGHCTSSARASPAAAGAPQADLPRTSCHGCSAVHVCAGRATRHSSGPACVGSPRRGTTSRVRACLACRAEGPWRKHATCIARCWPPTNHEATSVCPMRCRHPYGAGVPPHAPGVGHGAHCLPGKDQARGRKVRAGPHRAPAGCVPAGGLRRVRHTL